MKKVFTEKMSKVTGQGTGSQQLASEVSKEMAVQERGQRCRAADAICSARATLVTLSKDAKEAGDVTTGERQTELPRLL